MGDMGDIFRSWNESKKVKKQANVQNAIKILVEKGVKYKVFSSDHYRLGDYDFWPSTGLYIHIKTKKRGRGIFNLIGKFKPTNESEG